LDVTRHIVQALTRCGYKKLFNHCEPECSPVRAMGQTLRYS
jgi:hypothetical protein